MAHDYGGGTSDGHGVNPEELHRASNAITKCLPAPRDVKLADVPGNAEAYGHGDVFASLDKLCATWQLAVGGLGMGAEQISKTLLIASLHYAQGEESSGQIFTVMRTRLDIGDEGWSGSGEVSGEADFDGGRGQAEGHAKISWGGGEES